MQIDCWLRGSQANQGSGGCKIPVFPHQTRRCLQIRLRGISTQRHLNKALVPSLLGFSIINHPFGGISIYGNPQIYIVFLNPCLFRETFGWFLDIQEGFGHDLTSLDFAPALSIQGMMDGTGLRAVAGKKMTREAVRSVSAAKTSGSASW